MKKRFFKISSEDTGLQGLTVDLSGLSDFFENDPSSGSEDIVTYSVETVYMTQEEFEALPEHDDFG